LLKAVACPKYGGKTFGLASRDFRGIPESRAGKMCKMVCRAHASDRGFDRNVPRRNRTRVDRPERPPSRNPWVERRLITKVAREDDGGELVVKAAGSAVLLLTLAVVTAFVSTF